MLMVLGFFVISVCCV